MLVLFMRESTGGEASDGESHCHGRRGRSFEHYGDILFQLDNIDEAVKQWQKPKAGTMATR